MHECSENRPYFVSLGASFALVFFPHRAVAAFLPRAVRWAGVSWSMRALPPLIPISRITR